MSRVFFEELADALRGFLPRDARAFRHHAGYAGLKIWYASWHEHYEVQRIKGGGLEVGFHAEHPTSALNDETMRALAAKEKTWRRALGKEPVAGPFLGRKEHAARWRRVSEVWTGDFDDDGLAVEAAERLAAYVRALEPALARAEHGKCACWTA